MADLPPSPRPGDGTNAARPGGGPAHARPRWVTIFAVVAIVLVVAFVILHLAGGGMGSHG